MQPRDTSVDFAASPVADGESDVPVIVTILLSNELVPLVPSSAANLINMLSTLACVKAQDVN